jgi:hypothetical protein
VKKQNREFISKADEDYHSLSLDPHCPPTDRKEEVLKKIIQSQAIYIKDLESMQSTQNHSMQEDLTFKLREEYESKRENDI